LEKINHNIEISFDEILPAKYFLNQELPISVRYCEAALWIRRFSKSKLRLGLERRIN
jgi:hypothetical protein